MSTSSDIAAIAAAPHADKLLTEIVRLRRTTKRIAERLERAVDTSYSSSIDEFCASEGISRGQYYKLRKEGRGPREMRLAGQLVRITPKPKPSGAARAKLRPLSPGTAPPPEIKRRRA